MKFPLYIFRNLVMEDNIARLYENTKKSGRKIAEAQFISVLITIRI